MYVLCKINGISLILFIYFKCTIKQLLNVDLKVFIQVSDDISRLKSVELLNKIKIKATNVSFYWYIICTVNIDNETQTAKEIYK